MMVAANQPQILDRMSALADGLRSRLLLLLERQELGVTEICEVLQLPQSTVSRHLKTLADGDWVASRRDGTRRLYHVPLDRLDPAARRLWQLTRAEVATSAPAAQDAARLDSVLDQQRRRSRAFFASSAETWDRLRDDLFGTTFYLHAALGLLDPDWTVADLGCGTGRVAAALAPAVRRVIAIDVSEPMLEAARERLGGVDNVELQRAELESLPLSNASVDAAMVVLVLHHVPEPRRVLAEAARVLRPGGRVLVVDMLSHDREAYRQEMGHVWLGFSVEQVAGYCREAGFEGPRVRPLPATPAARGPALFVAAAARSRAVA